MNESENCFERQLDSLLEEKATSCSSSKKGRKEIAVVRVAVEKEIIKKKKKEKTDDPRHMFGERFPPRALDKYRVTLVVAYLGWVDLDLGGSTILLGQ